MSELIRTFNDQQEQRSDSNWEKVREEVTCAICLELLDAPKSMPCLHTYCKKCLMEALVKRPHNPDLPQDKPAVNCPLCRAEVILPDKGIEGLPSNFSATRLVETVQLQDKLEQNKTPLCDGCKQNDAITSCYDCSGFFLCEYCAKAHKNIPATKNHDLMSLKDISIPKASLASVKKSPLCQKHSEELLKLYCQDCEVLVCRDCVLVQHKNHDYSFVDDVVEEEKQKFKDVTLQELDKILTSTKEAITGVEQMQAKVLSCNDQHVTQLNKAFQEITDMVMKHKENLLDEMSHITKETLSPLKKQQADLITLKDNTEKCHDFTRNTLQNGTNSEIMSARKQMLERTKYLKESHDDSKLSPVTKPTTTVYYNLDKIRAQIKQILAFVDLQQCQIEDAPLEAYKEEAITLKLVLKDHKGQPIYNAADIFIVGVTTPTKDNAATSDMELGDGKYSVSFTPVAYGDHTVSIQINSMHIFKSPMNIKVKQVELIPPFQNLMFTAAGSAVVATTMPPMIQPSVNALLFSTTKQERPTNVTTSDMEICLGNLNQPAALQSNTHSTVVTCTNNRLCTPSPLVSAVAPPLPSTIGIPPQMSMIGIQPPPLSSMPPQPSMMGTQSQPSTVGKSIPPQPKKPQIFNQPKVTPRSKSRHQTLDRTNL